jgi:Fe-S-cluster containining protein
MDNGESLYEIIEFPDCDILIPFVCHGCGKCCRKWTWPLEIPPGSVPDIARHLNRPLEAIERELDKFYATISMGEPVDCPFIDDRNECLVYPLRPKCCRRYPLFTDFGTADIECPGSKEYWQVLDALRKRRRYAPLHEPQYFRRRVRAPSGREWRSLCCRFLKAETSDRMKAKFLKINQRSAEFGAEI